MFDGSCLFEDKCRGWNVGIEDVDEKAEAEFPVGKRLHGYTYR